MLARVTGRLGRLDARFIDAATAIALSAGAIVEVAGRESGSGFRADDLGGLALVLLQTLPIAVRRRAPIVVLAIISIALVVHSALGYQVVQFGTFSSLIAVYGAASLTDSRGSALTGIITALALVGFFAFDRGHWTFADYIATSGTWAVAWVAGTFVRLRSDQVEVVGARADRLEGERELRTREAVADERARMARELHDIVGHSLNVIVLQAAGAQRAFDTRPNLSRQALASIESAGRDALVDMERMLEVLHPASGYEDLAAVQPGLLHLDVLARQISQAGIAVSLEVEGDRPEVSASVDLSAYRIVQEALTNALKHSGASHATVGIHYHDDEIELEVQDNGRGPAPDRGRREGGGRGQVGMRERAAVFGGRITMGAGEAGGYVVHAHLPLRVQA